MWAQLGAMLTQLGAMLAYLEGYVGRSWGLCRPILRPMLAHVDPCGAKRSEKWEQQKNTVKRRIFWGSAAHLGGYVGPSWGYVGPSWGPCCTGLRLCGPILELCWPILGLCWSLLGAMLAHLGATFALLDAYVGPCWPTLNHKIRKKRKNAKSTKHRKTRDILAGPGGSPAGGAAPLSYGEERTAVRQCHGQGAPGRI